MLQTQSQSRPRQRFIDQRIGHIIHARTSLNSVRTLKHTIPVKAKLLLTGRPCRANAGVNIASNTLTCFSAHLGLLPHIGLASSVGLYRKLTYDPGTAYAPVGLVTDVPMTVIGKADLQAGSIGELLDYIRTNKDKVTFAHGGVGAVSHLCGLMLMDALDTKMTAVGYKGSGPAMTDLLGGQVDITCDQTTNTTSHIKSGKIKAYAVTTRVRLSSLLDLPTLDEAGLKGFEVTAWHGLYAPKGTPKEVVDKLVGALQTALKDPKVVERFADLGTEPVPQERATPAALEQHLRAEIAKWKPVIQAAGVYAD
jgi:tripartite-type tricarboxylate transporter receptor subunit TctC